MNETSPSYLPTRRRRMRFFAGAERGSRLTQAGISSRCERMGAAEHAPRGPCCFLERRYGLAEIVERGVSVFVQRLRESHPRFASNTSRRVVGQWGGAGGAICEDHFALAGSVRVATAIARKTRFDLERGRRRIRSLPDAH